LNVTFGKFFLRTFAVGGMLLGVTAAGLAVPSSSPLGTPEATAACLSFKRVKVVNKREILSRVAYGELRNSTPQKQTLVVERMVSDKKTTTKTYTGDWQLFKPVLTAQVSKAVAIEHQISGMQQARIEVSAYRTFGVTGYVRTWWVESEITERNSNCDYKTYRVSGDVATTDEVVWQARDIGAA
jgi:hypothetical protein